MAEPLFGGARRRLGVFALVAVVAGCGGASSGERAPQDGGAAEVQAETQVPAVEQTDAELGGSVERTESSIYVLLKEVAGDRPWYSTLVGVRVVTDTAILYFDPFAGEGEGFEAINSLPADDLCWYILNQSFPGVDHVKIEVRQEDETRAECP